MNPSPASRTTPAQRSSARMGAIPPEFAALAAGVTTGAALAALGATTIVILGLATIVAVVTWLLATALRIADDWTGPNPRVNNDSDNSADSTGQT